MKRQKQMQKAFGTNEFGLIDFPAKVSNVQLSRIVYCKKECSICFPHGWETNNSTRITNRQRNWKRFRKARWNLKKKGRIAPAFFAIRQYTVCLPGRSHLNGLSYISSEARPYLRSPSNPESSHNAASS